MNYANSLIDIQNDKTFLYEMLTQLTTNNLRYITCIKWYCIVHAQRYEATNL